MQAISLVGLTDSNCIQYRLATSSSFKAFLRSGHSKMASSSSSYTTPSHHQHVWTFRLTQPACNGANFACLATSAHTPNPPVHVLAFPFPMSLNPDGHMKPNCRLQPQGRNCFDTCPQDSLTQDSNHGDAEQKSQFRHNVLSSPQSHKDAPYVIATIWQTH